MDDGGWTQHVDKTGTPCAYCFKPSTRTLTVEPDEFSPRGDLKRLGKHVGLCDSCQPKVAEDYASAVHFRRRTSKGHEQLALVDRDTNAILK
jgi:hypothetical protein